MEIARLATDAAEACKPDATTRDGLCSAVWALTAAVLFVAHQIAVTREEGKE
jgi:hypothetical protein